MAEESGTAIFWGLAILWIALSFIAWWLMSPPKAAGDAPPRTKPWKLRTARFLGVLVLAIAFVLFLPWFVPDSEEFIRPAYITVMNASIALFVGIGIIMISRSSPAPSPGAPDAGGSGTISVVGGVGDPVEVAVVGEPASGGPAPGPGRSAPQTSRSQTITCPQCGKDFDMVIRSLPAAIKCPHCGVEGELDG